MNGTRCPALGRHLMGIWRRPRIAKMQLPFLLTSGRPSLRGGRVGPALKLRDGKGSTVTIESKSNYSSHKTLGCHLEPRGNLSGMKKHLCSKMAEFHRVLISSALNQQESWTFYFAIYLPSVGYPLPLCHFTKKELDALHRKVMSEMIARCGFCRKTKHEIIYGPADLGGACFRHPYAEQGIGQILLFLKHWRSTGQPSSLARVALSWAQFQSGTEQPILEECTTPLPHLEACWFISMRTFLQSIDGRIEVDNPFVLPPQREHDVYLMDAVMQSKYFTPPEIIQINYCRLYLQAITLSDITKADGKRLDPHMLIGRPSAESSTTRLHHTNQGRPDEPAWRLWYRANRLWGDKDQRLKQPLGRWLQPARKLRREWHSYYNIDFDELYISDAEGKTRIHPRLPSGFSYQADGYTTELPENSVPINTLRNNKAIHISHPTPLIPVYKAVPSNTFEAFLESLPDWERILLEHVNFQVDFYTLHHCLSTGQACIGVSDGSVRGDMGAFGWCISHSDGTRLATGMGPAQGSAPSSYQAEGYGMLAILRFLVRLCEFCGSKPLGTAMFCDNQALVNRIIKRLHCTRWYPNETITSDWDVIQAIISTLQTFDQCPYIEHVKGHQDDVTAYALLSLEAQLNIDADAAATEYQEAFGGRRWKVPRISGNRAQLSLSHKTITHHYVKNLRHAYCYPLLRAYIGKRNQWSDTELATIDWSGLGAACNKNHGQRHFVVKLSHDLLPTRAVTSQYDNSRPTACPFCLSLPETRDHLLRCTRDGLCQKWCNDLLSRLRKRCDSMHTNPVLLDIVMQGLDSWLRYSENPTPELYPAIYRSLIRDQNILGWRQLFNGRWSSQWATLQDRYLVRHFDPIPDNLSGEKWLTIMIDTTWYSVRQLWDQRNGRVYGVDSSTRAQLQKERTHQELRALYTLRRDMRHCDRDIFYATAAEHLEAQPVWALKNWLRIQTPMVKFSIKQAVRSAVSNVRTLLSYFGPTPNPD